ncbi:bifunctional glutamate N-acetyltransferase/amino-acid acetyltransferase ArgJ [uncultured Agrococcus sp.]|uniref:bifunctional glutamate N-acetyltransferase/amino-acid acetyltransferase ArgJ n=1 Tax=uncultured Agrococcus sp. TaxID=382258 RepID=UPI0025FFC59D|nr:bifunctional glutamate N-acetyltransferase/amino-acid acetyltransferase ArgJ [uncultured Agrococcus sp.]
MSVTTPSGFTAQGAAAGFKSTGARDLALVVNNGPLDVAAAVFTANRAKAAPVLFSERVVADGRARAVVLNSGGANCFTGEQGSSVTERTAQLTAEAIGAESRDVVVCSTGLIGEQLPVERFEAAVPALAAELADTDAAGIAAAEAIMTTDTVPKTAVYRGAGWSVGGMAKGAGMLAPGLATMLVVLTTDAVADAAELDAALRASTRVTFDRLDSDGCMSTNDTVVLLASGASDQTPGSAALQEAVTAVCADLARQLLHDAEGASHDIEIEVVGAVSEDEAVEVGRSCARSNLLMTAIFGNDPNWGRVLAAIGTTSASFDPYDVDVTFNGVRLCTKGGPDRPREECDLTPRRTHILIDLHAGERAATILTNDLTHDYVHENSAYSS